MVGLPRVNSEPPAAFAQSSRYRELAARATTLRALDDTPHRPIRFVSAGFQGGATAGIAQSEFQLDANHNDGEREESTATLLGAPAAAMNPSEHLFQPRASHNESDHEEEAAAFLGLDTTM